MGIVGAIMSNPQGTCMDCTTSGSVHLLESNLSEDGTMRLLCRECLIKRLESFRATLKEKISERDVRIKNMEQEIHELETQIKKKEAELECLLKQKVN